ncbi:MAG: hypothetical protein J5824_00990 [Lachnospiraceae bacterium]|nr:hypothetical protein [Lachnospiraceae bacterium]
MRYFFIDLENVRNEGLEGVLSLNEKDMVYIFYSENAFSMAIPTMESITNSKCSSKFIKTNYIGKNAMDFQIVSLFGAMIERCKDGSFYIISKDNGFRSAVSFCESFFSEYPIKCGVYPRIIAALAAQSRNQNIRSEKETDNKASVKASSDNNAEKTPDSGETEGKKSRSRRSRRRSGKRDNNASNSMDSSLAGSNQADSDPTDNDPADNDVDNVANYATNNSANNAVNNNETVNVPNDQTNDSADKTDKRSSRRRRGRNSSKGKADKSIQNDQSDNRPAGNTAESAVNGSNAAAENSAGGSYDTYEGAEASERIGRAEKNEAVENTNKLGYIYDLLKEYLSERTIDIYAGYIDEGIAKTSNRDELQKYFRDTLGDDEGEALFKVVRSDYEKYKKNRPKKTSRPRRHRGRKNSVTKETANE